MKIARLLHENSETYGFVKGDKIATKDEITYQTGVPIPQSIKDFLFDGWYDEIKDKIDTLPYKEDISKFKLLSPIPNPNKIICLAFNYIDHAKEQNLAEFLSFEVARAVQKCINFAKSKKISKITSTHLFFFLLIDNPKLNFIFSRAILDFEEIKRVLRKQLQDEPLFAEITPLDYSADFQEIIINSFKIAVKNGHLRIEAGDVLVALSETHP